ncbi:DEAD/DEAH box helicase [Ornithinimicrobium faecis]|uniref:DEAD/DEAH box helicase n=1 Tax=Ornithinimicrobium faecis TaxID=2934158 RepID=A0ABY4YS48_9MICO|nr:DEAD/DEAH box helicase [Ornithinimicrobium sp. HY1793]USQ79188.1 DEAD/DEAH box helicase [Ornithinimicrobium sp. HY1793]
MAELLPTLQARELANGLVDYLTTTFALADAEPRRALQEFLEDPDDGIFKGPYLRLRLPFRPADEGWERSLEWRPTWTPYRHQAQAYERLTTLGLNGPGTRPKPTLITTGTGSGKTEAFLHPIIDHVLRAKREGVTGTKAIILYPMNALADDQARRLTTTLTENPALSSVTAAVYTGNQAGTRTTVSEAGLITDRAVIRDSAPDILLTNYKMLDQLLLREADQPLWQQSALSLQYLVLDEFHTYDGAQGTDVAMLLRRLGLALKHHWPDDHPEITDADRKRPLGRITPVATSATLGDEGDPSVMLSFARTVFGEDFESDAVVTESLLSWEEWSGDAARPVGVEARRLDDLTQPELEEFVAQVEALVDDPEALTAELLGCLHGGDVRDVPALTLIAAHPDVRALVDEAGRATAYPDLVDALFPRGTADETVQSLRLHALEGLVAALSHVRADEGRRALGVELNFWVRELTRIDRVASAVPAYHWSDDGSWAGSEDADTVGATFPAIYCRHCGRSGWGVGLAAVGQDLAAEDHDIRRNHLIHEGRFRALLHAPIEDEKALAAEGPEDHIEGLRWLSVGGRTLLDRRPDEDDEELKAGRILPVLTRTGQDVDERARKDDCPSCQQADGIRFLGTAIATKLSVSLSILFGNAALDSAEKKSLVFTDSVQDAAHRAGFVQSRSHVMTLRATLKDAIGTVPTTLDTLVEDVMSQAGDDQFHRYRLVPPDCLLLEPFDRFWKADRLRDVSGRDRSWVKRRLLFDAALEVGLQSGFGRTLESTGSIVASVDAGPGSTLLGIARRVLTSDEVELLDIARVDDRLLVAWVRGLLERMRRNGGIEHEWLRTYLHEDGRRYRIWGGRPKTGMPAFPAGRAAPAFPRVGAPLARQSESGLDTVRSPQSWYARWAVKCLGVNAQHGAKLAERLLAALAAADLLAVTETQSQGKAYGIPSGSVRLQATEASDLEEGRTLLVCDTCQDQQPAAPEVVGQLAGAPCLVVRCRGTLERASRSDNFYRRLYDSADMRRVIAHEHTSLLHDTVRREVEEGFKASNPSPDAPNVLVATPTLEMGIDIGDLSTVMLSSLPDSVAKYVQRVGRAGRLTGNALNLAFVTGRGDQLPKLGNPLSVINGEVRPPATYLDAEEILRRQYLASIIDSLARSGEMTLPTKAGDALRSSAPESFLGRVLEVAAAHAEDYLGKFLGAFDGLDPAVVDGLKRWAVPDPDWDVEESLGALVHRASTEWQRGEESLERRRQEIEDALPSLQAAAESPAASDDDKRAWRSAEAAYKLTKRELAELRTQHWVSALEERGILPNYTLLDDMVTLEARVTWVDPETGTYESEAETVQRASSQALRELAPGATFYARGLAMRIDGLDMGQDASNVRSWVWCAECGYALDVQQSAGPAFCPRCESSQLKDTGQRFDVVRLEHVYSEVRRDRDLIDDRDEQRKRTGFSIATAADLDPAQVADQWHVTDGDFGVSHYRKVNIRWLNLGPRSRSGVTNVEIAGQSVAAALFRVCAGCGKLDSTANLNQRDEHRPWCRYRDSKDEDTRSVALSRELRTQGVVITLPISVTLGDRYAVPSVAASLLLGLRQEIGGAPDHLQVETVPVPVVGGEGERVREALLLHDLVPGGTGYLADLASAERVWRLLVKAYDVIAQCECRDEGRQACHRCILPFSRGGSVELLSNVSAERHLRSLLRLGEDETWDDLDAEQMRWTIEQGQAASASGESALELRFRAVFTERLAAGGATVHEIPGPNGNQLQITGLGKGRVWRLVPQENMHGAKPDFVLRTDDPNVPEVAIFTDGWQFHAHWKTNRIADDAQKRANLRDAGKAVLSVTYDDLVQEPGEAGPQWLNPAAVEQLFASMGDSAGGITQGVVDDLRDGPLSVLLGRMQRVVDKEPRRALSRNLGWLFLVNSTSLGVPADRPLTEVAAAVLDGEPLAGSSLGALWQRDHLVVVSRLTGPQNIETVVMLDDRREALEQPTHKAAWQEWLRISNAVTPAGFVHVTARSLGLRADAVVTPSPLEEQLESLTGAWIALGEMELTEAEKALLAQLASQGVPVPEVGVEVDGLPIDIAWPEHKVAVLLEADEDFADELRDGGWMVVDPDADLIAAALRTEGR